MKQKTNLKEKNGKNTNGIVIDRLRCSQSFNKHKKIKIWARGDVA